MKTSQLDILIVPGWSGSGAEHWQMRWLKQLKTARLVEQEDWIRPQREAWVSKITQAVDECSQPVLLVAHSLGCIAVAHAGACLSGKNVAGAFLVTPADVERSEKWPITNGHEFSSSSGEFAPIPRAPLPFPSLVIGSSDDPYCTSERAGELALAWGSVLVDAGPVGHLNVDSGHGPWPEGLMRLGWFLKNLG